MGPEGANILPYVFGIGIGYFTASFVIGRHIDNKVQDALAKQMLNTSWVFVNQRDKQTYKVDAHANEDYFDFEPDFDLEDDDDA